MRKFFFLTILVISISARAFAELSADEYYSVRDDNFSPNKSYLLYEAKAEQEDVDAKIMTFGLLYEFPVALENKAEQAIRYLLEAGTAGNPIAQYNLGLISTTGFFVNKDLENANAWLISARENGSVAANVLIGINLYELHRSQSPEHILMNEKEFLTIEYYLKYSEKLNDINGIRMLATLYFFQRNDFDKAKCLLKRAIALGDDVSAEWLDIFENQYYIEKNLKETLGLEHDFQQR